MVFLAVPFRIIPVGIAFRDLALEVFGVLFAVLRVLIGWLVALLVFDLCLAGVWGYQHPGLKLDLGQMTYDRGNTIRCGQHESI